MLFEPERKPKRPQIPSPWLGGSFKPQPHIQKLLIIIKTLYPTVQDFGLVSCIDTFNRSDGAEEKSTF